MEPAERRRPRRGAHRGADNAAPGVEGGPQVRAGAQRAVPWRWALPGALAAAGLWAVVARIGLSDLREALRQVSPGYAAAGLALAGASYLLKALRFGMLLRDERRCAGNAVPADAAGEPHGPPPFGRLLGVTLAQNLLAQIVPARAGDVGYVVLVRKTGLARVGVAVMSLILCRFADLLVVLGLYLWALAALRPGPPVFRQAAWAVGVLLSVAAAGFVALLLWRGRAVRVFGRVLRALRLLRLRPVRYLWDELRAALAHAGGLRLHRRLGAVLATTLLIWAATLLWNGLLWRAVSVRLSPAELCFIFSFTHIVSLLPVVAFAGVGTGDFIHASVLEALGRPRAPAASFSLCFRALSLAYMVLFAVAAGVLLSRGRAAAGARASQEGAHAAR